MRLRPWWRRLQLIKRPFQRPDFRRERIAAFGDGALQQGDHGGALGVGRGWRTWTDYATRATLTGKGPVRCVVFLIWDPGFQEPWFRFCADLSDLIFQIL